MKYFTKPHITKYFVLLWAVSSLLSAPAIAQTIPEKTQSNAEAIFAGGCFWCVESDFEKLDGVVEAISGYTGGHIKNPSYKQVSHENTGHYEAVKIIYDPNIISYNQLLNYYWLHIDPTDSGGQFCDRGHSYKTAIFANKDQIELARKSKQRLDNSHRLKAKIVTEIIPAQPFYKAEKYHQDYYKKNPLRYKYYRTSCGRDKRLRKLWGKHPNLQQ